LQSVICVIVIEIVNCGYKGEHEESIESRLLLIHNLPDCKMYRRSMYVLNDVEKVWMYDLNETM